MEVSGETRVVGFLGSTYRTSKMYALYNAAFEAMGLNLVYVPFCVGDLERAVEGIRHLGIAAVGVTIPYKVEILPYLDALDSEAERVGAANVVLNQGGRLVGGNTDGRGALRALQEQTEVSGRQIVLLGAGGAARALAFSLSDAGGELTILSRRGRDAAALAAAVGPTARGDTLDALDAALRGAAIVVNTTPVGMAGGAEEGESLVPAPLLREGMTVMELVSKPKETRLLREARAVGCRVVYGSRMLLWQSVDKFRMFTDVEPPVAVMERALEQAG